MSEFLQRLLSILSTIFSKMLPLLLCALFLLLLLLGRKGNHKRDERWRNAFYPYFALVFCIAALLGISFVNGLLETFLTNNDVRPYIDKALAWLNLSNVFDYGFLVYKVILINLLLSIAYVAAKFCGIGLKWLASFPVRLILWVVKKLKKQDASSLETVLQEKKKTLAQKYWEIFYQFDAEGRKAYIKPRYIKICKIFRLASYLLLACYFLLMIGIQIPVLRNFSWFPYGFFTDLLNVIYLYPVLSLIVLFEIADFLDGTDTPLETAMHCDDDTGVKAVTDYFQAQKILSATFSDRYVAGFSAPDSSVGSENTDGGKISDVTAQIRAFCQGDPSPEEQTPPTAPAPVNMEKSTEILHLIDSLEKGKDCLADASLYADMGDAFMVYVHLVLCRGDNVLVLCPDDAEVQNASAFITARLHSINQFAPVWIVKTEDQAMQSGDCDVLITTPTRLQDESVLAGQEQFFEHVRLILVPNTVKMLISYAGAFSWLAHCFAGGRLSQAKADGAKGFIVPARPVSYLFLNQGLPEELKNTLESITGRDLSIHECYFSISSTTISLWNEESRKIPSRSQERLFGKKLSSPFIGFMLPLALSSYKLTRTNILLLSSLLPYRDANQILKSRASLVKEYLDDEQGLALFERSISFQGGYEPERDPTVIIEDELRNLPCAVREAGRYHGAQGALVHIVSAPYLLRDFFQSQIKDGTVNFTENSGIFPLYIQSDAVRLKNLCSEFRQTGQITEERLLSALSGIELLGIQKGTALEEALQKFRDYILHEPVKSSLQYDFIFDWEETFNEQRAAFEYKRTVKLRDGVMKRMILSADREAALHFGGTVLRLGYPAENIYQRVLPGQAMVIGGKMFSINDIDLSTGSLYASAAPESLESPTEFIQNREYALTVPAGSGMEEKWGAPSLHYGTARLTVSLLSDMEISVHTTGYYSILPYDSAVRPASMLYQELNQTEMQLVQREIRGPVTIFRLDTQAQADPAKASVLLAVVLQELCKTFFPYCWQEIAVCPIGEGAAEVVNDMPDLLKSIYPTLISFPFRCDPREIGVAIIQDSASDNGIAQTMKKELEKPQSSLLKTVLEYLEWIEEGHIDSRCFLCYGEDKLPECFDLPGLIAALRQLPKPQAVPRLSLEDMRECCCYCGRALGARFFELKDSADRNNRRICQNCKDGLIKDKAELKRLYDQAVQYLTEGFNISLPLDIKVRFASARKIRRKAGTGDERSVLGFAYIKKNEIWVETLAPKANILQVLVHELTHVWQNNSLNFGKTDGQTIMEYKEGHASLMEVRYLFDTGRRIMATRTLQGLQARNDPYGKGFRRLLEELDGDYRHGNPFEHMREKFPRSE